MNSNNSCIDDNDNKDDKIHCHDDSIMIMIIWKVRNRECERMYMPEW